MFPSNSLKIMPYGLFRMLASTLSRPRWGIPMTISRTPELRRPLDDRVEQRDQHLAPFEREPLLADVVRVQERLEQLGRVELVG